MFSCKNRINRLLIFYIIISVLLPAGCDQTTRYKILTFFFEGVPPPGSRERARALANKRSSEESTDVTTAKDKTVRVTKRIRSSRHAPVRDCSKCHRGSIRKREKQLIEPIPDLCYSCHKVDYYRNPYVHGPVAVGACLFCHDPHQSGFLHLQKASQPDLCYQCHLRQDIQEIPGHQETKDVICTKCHDPHSSSKKKLIISRDKPRSDPNDVVFE